MPKCPACESMINELEYRLARHVRMSLDDSPIRPCERLIEGQRWESIFYVCPLCEEPICQNELAALNWLTARNKTAKETIASLPVIDDPVISDALRDVGL